MNSPRKEHEEQIEWLKTMLAVAGLAGLAVLRVYAIPENVGGWWGLLRDAIPSAAVVLAAGVIVYLVFYSKGIRKAQLNTEELATAIVERLLTTIPKEPRFPELLEFHETYRNVDWKKLLDEHTGQLDIVVYYFDSWVNANHEALVSFFKKPATKARIFVADPANEHVLETVNRLFPEYDRDTVRGKVERTGERFALALNEAGGDPSRVEFYVVPYVLNYSAQCLDDRTLVLSVFEMNRKQRIDSPALVIDLTKSPHLASWWRKEIDGLLKSATKKQIKT